MSELATELQRYIRVWLRIAKNRFKLFKIEFKIAKSTIKPLLILVSLLLMTLLSTWLLLLILIGVCVFALTANILISVTSVLLLNILFIILLYQGIKFLVNVGSFQKTRKYFRKENIKSSNP